MSKIDEVRSASEVKYSHSYTSDWDNGTESVSNDCSTSQDSSESSFVWFDKTRPNCTNVGGSTNDEKYDNNHAVEVEECALLLWLTVTIFGFNFDTIYLFKYYSFTLLLINH